jgi:hypothetical protein
MRDDAVKTRAEANDAAATPSARLSASHADLSQPTSSDQAPSSRTSGHQISSNATAWLVVATVAALLVVPLATRRGIFLDGLVYATISRNMSVGVGDFWHPVYVGAIAKFRDHPPLAFWLESLAFRLLGDHWCVEKIYSVFTGLVTGGIMVAIWRWLARGKRELQSIAWLPLLMWITLPCWQWTLCNNLLENTLGIFTAASVYCVLRALPSRRFWAAWTLLAALAIVAAALVKGPVGLFPLVAPMCAALCFRGDGGFRGDGSFDDGRGVVHAWRTKAVLVQGLLVLLVAFGIGLLLCRPDCQEYFQAYWHKQVMASLRGQRETHPSIIGRAHILWEVFTNVAPSMTVAGALGWWAGRRQLPAAPLPRIRQSAMFCAVIGIMASFPVAISPKQTNFYVTPSYPFYVLGIALWCAEALVQIRATISTAARAGAERRLRRLAAGALVVLAIVSCVLYGKPRRDWREIEVARIVSQTVPSHTSIDVTPEVAREWALLGYLDRNHFIRMERKNADREFRLEVQGSGEPPPGYEPVAVEMPRYRLWRRAERLQADRPAEMKPR